MLDCSAVVDECMQLTDCAAVHKTKKATQDHSCAAFPEKYLREKSLYFTIVTGTILFRPSLSMRIK
jgi:hypothetical protein